MAPEARVFVTGPDVVRSVTGEQVDMASLGGPDTHTKKSGVAHIAAHDEADALHRARRLVSMFCEQGEFDQAAAEHGDTDLRALMPESAKRAYDVRPIVHELLDNVETASRVSRNCRAITPAASSPVSAASAAAPSASSPTTRCASVAA